MKGHFRAVIALAIAGLLAGCVAPMQLASSREMALPPESASAYGGDAPLKGKLAVGTVGNAGMSSMLQNPIATKKATAEFAEALKASLQTSNLAALSGQSAYTLNALLTKIETPFAMSDDTKNVDVTYTLVRNSDGKEIFSTTISSSHTATFSDSMIARVRDGIALNRSFRKNIEQIVDRLYKTAVQ